jgi:hypothetical protein
MHSENNNGIPIIRTSQQMDVTIETLSPTFFKLLAYPADKGGKSSVRGWGIGTLT